MQNQRYPFQPIKSNGVNPNAHLVKFMFISAVFVEYYLLGQVHVVTRFGLLPRNMTTKLNIDSGYHMPPSFNS